MGKPIHILIVEDLEDDALLVIRALKKGDYDPTYERVETAEAMGAALREKSWDVILCDYKLPRFNGLDALALYQKIGIDIPFIIVSGTIGEEVAVQAMKAGAHDYIMKDKLSRLVPAIERELKEAESRAWRRQAEERQALVNRILNILNRPNEIVNLIRNILLLIKEHTGIEAVAIRLHEGDDFPYYETNGFPPHFVEAEKYLCARDDSGTIIRDSQGHPVLECMCGNILSCRTDPSFLYFTEGGSFWTNSTTKLLASTSEEDRQARTRNRCHGEGYESVALIPLKSGEKIIGLLQLNDKRQDRFTLDIIQFFEGIGATIGIAVYRQQSANDIIKSEEKYRTILEDMEEGYYEADLRGSFTFFNASFRKLMGYPQEELMGMNYRQYVADGANKKKAFKAYRRVFQTGAPCNSFTWDLIRKGGDRKTVEVSISLIKDKDNQPIGFRGIVRDITDRIRAETMIRNAQQRQSDIIEFLPDATLVIDREGQVIAWNRAMETMTGVKSEDMLGRGNYEYALPFYGERRPILIDLALHPEPEMEKTYTNIERNGDILVGEAFTPMLLGKKAHLSATACVLKDATGEAVAAIECIRDNTDKKKSEEDLRQAEERYRSIFENAQEGIFQSTPEGRYLMANHTMARMLGYDSPVELMTGITDIASQIYIDPHERAKLIETIENKGVISNYELQMSRKDGGVIWGSLTMHAIRDKQGRLLYYEGMNADITDRKESVARLRKALGGTVQAISMAVETKDPYTAGHQRRTADLARAIAVEMGLSADRTDFIRIAATIHDIGKIAVPAEILSKPSKLSDLEFSLIRTHAQAGYDILKDIEFPWPVAEVIIQHHERMDGSGYPNGMRDGDILLEARILTVADVVESMASHRPYRPALGIEAALEEISKNRAILYDADAVDACLKLFREEGYTLV